MNNMDNTVTSQILNLIKEKDWSELESERFINALTRLESGVPTGTDSRNH